LSNLKVAKEEGRRNLAVGSDQRNNGGHFTQKMVLVASQLHLLQVSSLVTLHCTGFGSTHLDIAKQHRLGVLATTGIVAGQQVLDTMVGYPCMTS
jgi:hypothetical protein